jgi:ankyrin repeat protein
MTTFVSLCRALQLDDASTPLHEATLAGRVDIVGTLLRFGADLTLLSQGRTPVQLAEAQDGIDVAAVLLEEVRKCRSSDCPFFVVVGGVPWIDVSKWLLFGLR